MVLVVCHFSAGVFDAIVTAVNTPCDSMESFSVVPKAGLAGIGPTAGAQQTVMSFLLF